MKIRSIQFKFLTTILAAMLAITIFIGGLSIYEVDQFIQKQTESFVNVTCEKEAMQVNEIFDDMEKSVNIMKGYVLDFFDSTEDFKNRDKQKEVIEYSDKMFTDVANYTVGAVAYYLRFAPEISDTKTGFFYSKTEDSDKYVRFEPTDLARYNRYDTEHVGWYWQPYDAGEPVWMKPYYNQNNDIIMVSYVVPLYCGEKFVGIVGMDFDYTVLIDKVHNIKIYENGFAHLELDGVPIHFDGELQIEILYNSDEYLQASQELSNDMTLVLSASYDDIRQIRYEIGLRILFIVLILTAIFCAVTIYMVRRIVKPLKMLTEASKKLADGDYDIEPVISDTYEIQLLGTAFENMSMKLRENEKLQYLLTYRDSLTGLRNTTSYKVWVTDLDKEMQEKNTKFGVIVFDVNYLKETNDKYGHDMGNKLIVAVGQLISGIFKRSPVFRIGGDEFLVILQNRDLEDYEALCEKLDYECANQFIDSNDKIIPISIARGFAMCDYDTDKQFVDVFNRADDAMYKHKRKMKASEDAKQFFKENDTVHP